MKRLLLVAAAVLAVAVPLTAVGLRARGTVASIEVSAQTGIAGGKASSSNYEATSVAKITGTSAASSSSTYSVTPVETTGNTSVGNWRDHELGSK